MPHRKQKQRTDWLAGWRADWLACWPAGWLAGLLACLFAGWLAGWLAWLVGWLARWLARSSTVCPLTGGLSGLLVCCNQEIPKEWKPFPANSSGEGLTLRIDFQMQHVCRWGAKLHFALLFDILSLSPANPVKSKIAPARELLKLLTSHRTQLLLIVGPAP